MTDEVKIGNSQWAPRSKWTALQMPAYNLTVHGPAELYEEALKGSVQRPTRGCPTALGLMMGMNQDDDGINHD